MSKDKEYHKKMYYEVRNWINHYMKEMMYHQKQMTKIDNEKNYNKKLETLRNQIDSADKALYEALHSRLQVVTKIADLKKEYGILEMSKPRQTEILEKLSYHENIPNSLIFKLYNIIFEYSIKKQESIINKK